MPAGHNNTAEKLGIRYYTYYIILRYYTASIIVWEDGGGDRVTVYEMGRTAAQRSALRGSGLRRLVA